MVYFISDGTFTKIGKADEPNRRLKKLQTGNVKELKLINLIEGDYEIESKLHEIFHRYRVRGEWFNLPEYYLSINKEDVNDIYDLIKPLSYKSLSGLKDTRPKSIESISEIIHNSAQLALNEYEPLVKVTKPIVLDYVKKYSDVNNQKNIVNNIGTLRKHIEHNTELLLDKGNKQNRPFGTKKTKSKYEQFLEMNGEGLSLDAYAKELSVSKTTVMDFKQLRDKQ